MNFCRSGVVCFIHPEHVLRDEPVVHYGEPPRVAASFNTSVQPTRGLQPRVADLDRSGADALAHSLPSDASNCTVFG